MACNNVTITPLHDFSTAALIDVIRYLKEICPEYLVDGIGIRDDIASKVFQGENSFFAASLGLWTPYAAKVIFSRLIDFKLPLLQLISELPRPRLILGWRTQVFAVLHLVADPIDSMSGYFFTLATCMGVLRTTKEMLRDREERSTEIEAEATREVDERFDKRCKFITLVYLSYASNGHPKPLEYLIRCEKADPAAFQTAALALAADRGSNFWAVGVAIFGFTMAVVLKYVYIDAETFDADNPQHIDIWSLSSSLTMVHIVPNVLLASIISVQQSHFTAGRFLQKLEEHLHGRPVYDVLDGMQTDWTTMAPDRQLESGAVPNWRPDRRYACLPLNRNAIPVFWPWILDVVAFLIITTGSAGAMWLAAAVPPQGLNCRTVVKVIMISLYVVKYAAQLLVNQLGALLILKKMYVTAAMDLIFVLSFAFVIFSTQSGILNRPGCYRQCKAGGECGVYPASVTWGVVQERLHGMYPGILFGFIGMQILFCGGLLYVFREAKKVYLPDDEPLAEGEGDERDGGFLAEEERGTEERRENQDMKKGTETQVIKLRPMPI